MSATQIRNLIQIIESFDREVTTMKQIYKEYSIDDLCNYDYNTVSEDMENLEPYSTGIWDIRYSNAFRKGRKKHRNNPKVAKELAELENWIVAHNSKPEKNSFPPKFNVHIINKDPTFSGAYDAHIIGRQIITLFYIENENDRMKLSWVHVGTHSEASPYL